MLSYQHAFHAGNHADILKHFTLFSVLEYMTQKEAPISFFDTHAGSGLYFFDDERAQKTGERKSGISRLLLSEKLSDVISADDSGTFGRYIDFVKEYCNKNLYPGSPIIENALLRKNDVLNISELHPAEYENLQNNVFEWKDKFMCKAHAHHRNGFEMLQALTPPKTVRGAVLIDPSYEELSDYDDVENSVVRCFKKWRSGVFMIWYPLIFYRQEKIDTMIKNICRNINLCQPSTEICDFKLCVADKNFHKETSLSETKTPRLYGSGMLIINAPWTLSKKMQNVLPRLEEILKMPAKTCF